MVGKFRYGIDHAKNSAKTNDFIQAADLVAQRRKQLKPNVARVLLCLVQSYIATNFPCGREPSGLRGPVPARKTRLPSRVAGT
jgi:hypothetical protein